MAPAGTANRAASPAPRKAVEVADNVGDENVVAPQNAEAVILTEIVAKESVVVKATKVVTEKEAVNKEVEQEAEEAADSSLESAPKGAGWKRILAVFIAVITTLSMVFVVTYHLWYHGLPSAAVTAFHRGVALTRTAAVQKASALVVTCTATGAAACMAGRLCVQRRHRSQLEGAAVAASLSTTAKPKSE